MDAITTSELLNTAVVSATTTLLAAVTTATSAAEAAATTLADGAMNGNGTVPPPVADEPYNEGNYLVNTMVGLLIVLAASVLNALGLNLTKLDHQRQQMIPKRQRRKEYLRPLWLGGMGIYIASQLFGSPLALRYIRPDWVAPLGASALVFNFLFAYWLVGTPVTTSDIRGTGLIVLGVILIVIFSSINHGLRQDLPIEELNRLWSRGAWLSYFFILLAATFGTYVIADLLERVLRSRASFSPLPSPTMGLPTSRRSPPQSRFAACKRPFTFIYVRWKSAQNLVLARLEPMLSRTDDGKILWLQGIAWAVAGGSLAGLCLVFTKGVVKMFVLPGHPLVHPSPLVTLLFTIATAVTQIICLNKALACADTVVVVPLFYAGYTVFGFINSLIFYDQTGQYARWALVCVFLSIGVLIGGVVLLSMKSAEKAETTTETTDMRMTPRARPSSPGSGSEETAVGDADGEPMVPKDEVMWEVGDDSDDSDEDENDESKQKGIGGTSDSHGERGGLLLAVDEEDDGYHGRSPRSPTVSLHPLSNADRRSSSPLRSRSNSRTLQD